MNCYETASIPVARHYADYYGALLMVERIFRH